MPIGGTDPSGPIHEAPDARRLGPRQQLRTRQPGGRPYPTALIPASPSGEPIESNSPEPSAIAIGSLSAALQVGGGGHMQVTKLFDDFVVEVRVLEDALGFGQGKSQTLFGVLC